MSTHETTPRPRRLKLVLWVIGVLLVGAAAFFGWTALETHQFAQRIHLLTSEKSVRVGMTQEEVENLFGVKPQDRRPPDSNGPLIPARHEGVKRYREMKDGEDTIVNYTEWYQGLIVTSQHHVRVTYDAASKVKKWDRGSAD